MKRIWFLWLIGVLLCTTVHAQKYDNFFTGQTLRLDYSFVGNAEKQYIALDEMYVIPNWYGKRQHLNEVPMRGNGQISVYTKRTGELIYRNSFSTLFQEWLTYPEAKTTNKAFQNVFLVPMPKDTAKITVELYNNRQEVIATFTHEVLPTDILIRHIGERNITPYRTLRQAKDSTRCIHIAYIAEGYQQEEMERFLQDAKEADDAIFAHEPFKSMSERFHVIAVMPPSLESGTSEPANGIWKETPLHAHFDTFYSDRYLTTLHLKDMHDLLAGTPYEHIIVLVNTEKYGGGGILNSYNLAMTHHPMYRQVVVHEFGHSFGGLADEYAYDFEQLPFYPLDKEPWEPNITTKVDFGSKWKDMVGKNGVGLYEGAGYTLKGVFRPTKDCRMHSNETPDFCPVCQRSLRRTIDFYTK